MSGMKKFDSNKPLLAIVPLSALKAITGVMEFGAKKYGLWNYKEPGMTQTRLLSATLRHIYQHLEGADLDDESGLPHLSHAIASLTLLIDKINNNSIADDRFKPKQESDDIDYKGGIVI
jgi:hypothetical protein